MSKLHKIVSFFQPDSKSGRKNLLAQQKVFASEINIRTEIEDLKNQWGTLIGYRVKGTVARSFALIHVLYVDCKHKTIESKGHPNHLLERIH